MPKQNIKLILHRQSAYIHEGQIHATFASNIGGGGTSFSASAGELSPLGAILDQDTIEVIVQRRTRGK